MRRYAGCKITGPYCTMPHCKPLLHPAALCTLESKQRFNWCWATKSLWTLALAHPNRKFCRQHTQNKFHCTLIPKQKDSSSSHLINAFGYHFHAEANSRVKWIPSLYHTAGIPSNPGSLNGQTDSPSGFWKPGVQRVSETLLCGKKKSMKKDPTHESFKKQFMKEKTVHRFHIPLFPVLNFIFYIIASPRRLIPGSTTEKATFSK
jgi:hypothetical protein